MKSGFVSVSIELPHSLQRFSRFLNIVSCAIEYNASPCWYLNLTKEQTKQLEDVQRRALQVIFGNVLHDEVRRIHNIPKLAERRLDLSRTFFKRIIRDNSNVLRYLLPAKRDQLTARLRYARQYSTIYARTNRYKNSLIVYGL